jgi:hypothetical protein
MPGTVTTPQLTLERWRLDDAPVTASVDGVEAAMTTALWCGDLCGAGGTYELEWTESEGWRITGMEGPQWIS